MSIRSIIFFFICIYFTIKSFKYSPIVLCCLIISMYFIYPERYIWGISEYRIVLVLNVLLYFSILFHGRSLGLFSDKYSILMLLLLSSFIVSATFAKVNVQGSYEYAFLFFKVVFFWFMLKSCLSTEAELLIFHWTCLLAVSFLAAWGVEQYLLGNVRLEGFGGGQILGSNQIAAAMVWALPIAYFKFIHIKGWSRWVAFCCVFLLLAGLVCAQSRQAVVAVLVCLPWYFVYVKRKMAFIVVALIVVFAGSIFVPVEFFERVETIEQYESDSSAQGRIEQWKGAIEMFLDNPVIGVGGKNYYILAHRYVENPRVTHNTYFQILSEEGAFGIIVFSSLFIVAIVVLSKLSKFDKNLEMPQYISHYAVISKISIIGLLVVCVFQNKAEHEYLYWPIAVTSVLSAHANRIKSNPSNMRNSFNQSSSI